MRVLMFSWEFPPRSVGGLAQHVHDLSIAMVKEGHEVHVITCGGDNTPLFEEVNGVKVHRVQPYTLAAPNFIMWVEHLNMSMVEYGITLMNSVGNFDVIHAHDWLSAYAGRIFKYAYQIPLIATIHATEYGRNCGLHNDTQRYISDVEWWLTYEAWRVICCSNYMKNELKQIFQLPDDKIKIIPNGVNPENFQVKNIESSFKQTFASGNEKVVFYVGRLVQEKGVQVLIEAIPKILHYHPNTKFIIAGKGPNAENLKNKAGYMGVTDRIYFTGYIDDETRNKLYHIADVAVFPSLYEPFGIVALEGMAARTPVVVSDTGGLGEIVQHNVNGLKAYTGSANSLADNILQCLFSPEAAKAMEERAFIEIQEKYNWTKIAKDTIKIYQEVISEERAFATKGKDNLASIYPSANNPFFKTYKEA